MNITIASCSFKFDTDIGRFVEPALRPNFAMTISRRHLMSYIGHDKQIV